MFHIFRQSSCFSNIVKRIKLEVETKNITGFEIVKDFEPFENRFMSIFFLWVKKSLGQFCNKCKKQNITCFYHLNIYYYALNIV